MEDKAKEYTEKQYYKVDNVDEFNGEPLAVYRAYSQCQEDMAKELEQLRKAIRKNTWYDIDGYAQVNLYGIDNSLLNKQNNE